MATNLHIKRGREGTGCGVGDPPNTNKFCKNLMILSLHGIRSKLIILAETPEQVRELMEGLEDSTQVERESEQVVWSYLQSPATLSDMAEFLPDTRYVRHCCQLFAELFGRSKKKNSAAQEKNSVIFTF
jgi:hypothetical protein